MTKDELIQSINPTQTYLGSFIRDKVSSIAFDNSKLIPDKIKVGDLFVSYVGVKKRPCVVVKVYKDYIVSIPLTSSENIKNGVPYKCRFLGEGYLCNSYEIHKKEFVFQNFRGIFDDRKAIKLAIENIKNIVNKL